jgi:N-formylglutamate amidohydrolase
MTTPPPSNLTPSDLTLADLTLSDLPLSDLPLFDLQEGGSRLLVNVPHAGTYLPPWIMQRLSPAGLAVLDTDWHVDQLYAQLAGQGVTLLTATHSRTVVDLNRSSAGGLLYPGQAETGLCPTETFDGVPLYNGEAPDAVEIAQRIEMFWQPYHDALAAQIRRLRALHGVVHVLDGHSIRGEIPRLFEGSLPDLNFGTNTGASCDPALAAAAQAAVEGSGFTQVLNGRFKGGYITRHYGKPADGVHVIQLELAQRSYMDEDATRVFDPARAARLMAVLGDVAGVLLRA